MMPRIVSDSFNTSSLYTCYTIWLVEGKDTFKLQWNQSRNPSDQFSFRRRKKMAFFFWQHLYHIDDKLDIIKEFIFVWMTFCKVCEWFTEVYTLKSTKSNIHSFINPFTPNELFFLNSLDRSISCI